MSEVSALSSQDIYWPTQCLTHSKEYSKNLIAYQLTLMGGPLAFPMGIMMF